LPASDEARAPRLGEGPVFIQDALLCQLRIPCLRFRFGKPYIIVDGSPRERVLTGDQHALRVKLQFDADVARARVKTANRERAFVTAPAPGLTSLVARQAARHLVPQPIVEGPAPGRDGGGAPEED